MTIYKSPALRIDRRLFWQPYCVTNKDKALFWALAVGGGGSYGAFLGWILGAALGALVAAPVAATGVGLPLAAFFNGAVAVAGLILGTVTGLALGVTLAWKSACPECGACFKLLMLQTLFPVSAITPVFPVIPPLALPNTGDCPIIPPGCP